MFAVVVVPSSIIFSIFKIIHVYILHYPTTSSKQLAAVQKLNHIYMEEPKKEVYATSLAVPSVKELVKSKTLESSILKRYLHRDVEPTFIPENGTPSEQLPLLSLDALLQGDVAELSKLRHACTDWGFFQLVSHGVKSEVIERFKVAGKELFDMPMEEKRKFWRSPQDIDGFGEKFVFSEEQKLNWADSFALNILPLHLRKPHLLPLLPLPIREALEAYTSEIKQLATKIFDCMAEDLKIDIASWRRLFDDGREYIRMACYPPCPQYDKVIGSSPHSDASALTIVIQLNQVDGLEFKKDGRWLPITPLPEAFIVNIGDVMEILSNGIYKSVEHRVMVDPKMERLSAATFFHAGVEAEVGPAEGLVTSDTPARFRKTTTSEYLKGYFARPMTGKLYLDTVRIDV